MNTFENTLSSLSEAHINDMVEYIQKNSCEPSTRYALLAEQRGGNALHLYKREAYCYGSLHEVLYNGTKVHAFAIVFYGSGRSWRGPLGKRQQAWYKYIFFDCPIWKCLEKIPVYDKDENLIGAIMGTGAPANLVMSFALASKQACEWGTGYLDYLGEGFSKDLAFIADFIYTYREGSLLRFSETYRYSEWFNSGRYGTNLKAVLRPKFKETEFRENFYTNREYSPVQKIFCSGPEGTSLRLSFLQFADKNNYCTKELVSSGFGGKTERAVITFENFKAALEAFVKKELE